MNHSSYTRRLGGAMLAVALLGFAAAAGAAPVNVNTANADALAANLEGVGPSLARAIIADRTEHGPYKSAADLARVKGIGPKVIERNRASILVSDPPGAGRK